jgi:hypothetical protein
MDSFAGKFDYLDEKGTVIQSGTCRLNIDKSEFRVIPEKGGPLALDLGDVDIFFSGDYELALKLHTGRTISLHHFAKAFEDMCESLKNAYRSRLLQCLLLEDLEEIARFEGCVQLDSTDAPFAGPAEIRLYRSNVAILPERAPGMHWRLSDIDGIEFDAESYRLELRSGSDRLIITRLAKRTDEFRERLRCAMDDVSERSAGILRDIFPFLSPDQFQSLAEIMKEGRSAPISKMASIHPQVTPVFMKSAVLDSLRPYIDSLMERKAAGFDFYAGFKMIRPEGEAEAADAPADGSGTGETGGPDPDAAGDSDEGIKEKDDRRKQALHWFFFPMTSKPGSAQPADVIAWEAASHAGRATYFFRVKEAEAGTGGDAAENTVERTVERLGRALVMINFRREPVYLPDDSLMSQARYRHYAIAARRLPVLQELRALYVGRAVHSAPEAWRSQVEAVLARV